MSSALHASVVISSSSNSSTPNAHCQQSNVSLTPVRNGSAQGHAMLMTPTAASISERTSPTRRSQMRTPMRRSSPHARRCKLTLIRHQKQKAQTRGFEVGEGPVAVDNVASAADLHDMLVCFARDPMRSKCPAVAISTGKQYLWKSIGRLVVNARCISCQKGTCSMQYQTTFDPRDKTISIATRGSHGILRLQLRGGWLTKQAFKEAWTEYNIDKKMKIQSMKAAAQAWAHNTDRTKFPKPFDLGYHLRKRDKTGKRLVELRCVSCKQQPPCSWRGQLVHDGAVGTLRLQHHGTHYPAGQCKRWGTLTTSQRMVLTTSKAKKSAGKLVALTKLEESPPKQDILIDRSRNEKKTFRKRKHIEQAAEESTDVWTVAVIKQAMRDNNLISLVDCTAEERASIVANSPDDAPMILAERSFVANNKEHYAVAIASKELLRIISKLANRRYVKLCGDATFKCAFENWCLVTVGSLTKQYGRIRTPATNAMSGHTAWSTHFSPLVYVFASGETSEAYDVALQGLIESVQAVCAVDLRDVCRQFHADLTATAERARKERLPKSIRVADYRHVIEAAKSLLQRSLVCRDEHNDLKHKKDVINAMRLSRTTCMTATEFHFFTALLFQTMEDWGEEAAAELMQHEYYFLLPSHEASEQYSCNNMVLLQNEHIWCAPFWHGLQRVQCGSASGSQAQESAHYHVIAPQI